MVAEEENNREVLSSRGPHGGIRDIPWDHCRIHSPFPYSGGKELFDQIQHANKQWLVNHVYVNTVPAAKCKQSHKG